MSKKHLTLADALSDDMLVAGLIVIPRNYYSMLKEAAEKWAEKKQKVWGTVNKRECKCCLKTSTPIKKPILHTADCKAAIILDLPREEKP